MSEKQAKRERQEARQLIAEFNIRAYQNGDVEILGPFHNFLLFRQTIAQAELAAINHIAQGQNNRIVVPQIQVPTKLQ